MRPEASWSVAWADRRSAATWPPSRSEAASAGRSTPCAATSCPPAALPDRAVLCSSYSGDTEETIACYEAAEALGARRIVATTGGELAAAARRDGVPVIGLPAGLAAPRRGRLPVHGRRRGRCAGRGGARDPDRDRQLRGPPAGGQRLARRAGRRARRAARGIDPRDLRSGPDGARRRPLEDPDQRERQAARVRGRAARGRPQRDRRLGRRERVGAPQRRLPRGPRSAPPGQAALRADREAGRGRLQRPSPAWRPRARAAPSACCGR